MSSLAVIAFAIFVVIDDQKLQTTHAQGHNIHPVPWECVCRCEVS